MTKVEPADLLEMISGKKTADKAVGQKDDDRTKRIRRLTMQAELMSDDELGQAENYFGLLISSRVRRVKNAKAKGGSVDRDAKGDDGT